MSHEFNKNLIFGNICYCFVFELKTMWVYSRGNTVCSFWMSFELKCQVSSARYKLALKDD